MLFSIPIVGMQLSLMGPGNGALTLLLDIIFLPALWLSSAVIAALFIRVFPITKHTVGIVLATILSGLVILFFGWSSLSILKTSHPDTRTWRTCDFKTLLFPFAVHDYCSDLPPLESTQAANVSDCALIKEKGYWNGCIHKFMKTESDFQTCLVQAEERAQSTLNDRSRAICGLAYALVTKNSSVCNALTEAGDKTYCLSQYQFSVPD